MQKRLWLALFAVMIAVTASGSAVFAAAPYDGYNYNYWREATPSPIGYLPDKVIEGEQLGAGPLNSPEDIFVTKDDRVYILDSGNGRILSLDSEWNLLREIRGFYNDGKMDSFNKPEGIFVTDEGNIYVADTENKRIVELNSNGTLVRIIEEPKSDVFRSGFAFFPRKIQLDKAKRIYVISRGVYDGIMEFDNEGTFNSFIGAIKVGFKPLDYLWKLLATKAQREKMSLFIPIEFNNMSLDSEGFIYTTSYGRSQSFPIQRLNPTGTDILRQEGYFPVWGDQQVSMVTSDAYSGFTQYVDIHVNEYGMYSALDSKRGRIFTYDEDGQLLYVFGIRGKQEGTFKTPVAIERWKDRIIVLDKDFSRLTLFKATAFGKNVNDAVMYHYNGLENESADAWWEVLKYNGNFNIAYIGIGKALLRQGDNKQALEYFDKGMNRKYYSKAFQRYRKDVMRDTFGTMMTTIVVLIVAFMAYRVYRRYRKARFVANAHSDG